MSLPKNSGWLALPFLLPNLAGFALFTAGPVLGSLLLSFCSWDLLTPPVWVGGRNFGELLGFVRDGTGHWQATDPRFWQYLWNTAVLLLNLPLSLAGSLGLALLLNRRLPGMSVYRLIFFLPTVVSGVAVFYLWRWMLNPEAGLINTLLAAIGVSGPAWLSDPRWAKPAILLMSFWLSVGGGGMLLYLAALQQVPRELQEAAEIDGAGPWRSFLAVTWPALRPVTFFMVTTGLIHGLQSGGEMAYIMTSGGPAGSTTTLGFYVFQKAYVQFDMGYAAAIAWVMFALVLGVTLLRWQKNAAQFSGEEGGG